MTKEEKTEFRKNGRFTKGTKVERVARYLVSKVGKPVKLKQVAKKVHAKDGKILDPVQATRMNIIGFNRHIKKHRLPYKPVTYCRLGGEIAVLLESA